MAEGQDDVFEILIKFGLDDQAARQASGQIKNLKEDTHEGAKHIELFNTHGREMRKLMHEIAHQSPIVGLALRAAFHPAALGIVGLMVAFEQVKKKIEEQQKAAEEAAAAVREAMAAGWEANNKAAEAGLQIAKSYREVLRDVSKETDHISQVMQINLAFAKELGGTEKDNIRIKQQALDEERKELQAAQQRLSVSEAAVQAAATDKGAAAAEAWAKAHAGDFAKAQKAQQEAAAKAAIGPGGIATVVGAAAISGEEKAFPFERERQAELAKANAELLEAARARRDIREALARNKEHLDELNQRMAEDSAALKQHAAAVNKLTAELEVSRGSEMGKNIRESIEALNRGLQSLGINFDGMSRVIEESFKQSLSRIKSSQNNPT